jgi:hypothetical protein
MTLLKGGDGVTTVIALHNGAHESAPSMFQRPVLNALFMAGGTTGMIYTLNKLSVKHPKWAATLAVGQMVGSSFVIRHNIGVIRRLK